MKIGLFFGSFNPMHVGHKIIASYMVEFMDLDKVCFIVSPQNPEKNKSSLLDQYHRLQIIRHEIEDENKLIVSDIEFTLPVPSYTIDTLSVLKEKYPKNDFSLIMGSDNIKSLHKWKNYKEILKYHRIYVYPREGHKLSMVDKNIYYVNNVPKMEISASFIRSSIKEQKDVSYLVPEKAWSYIEKMNFYK